MVSPPQAGAAAGNQARSTPWVSLVPLMPWALVLWLVPPTGEFPLNDDWIYAGAVRIWLETGHYTGHPFSTASLVAQASWGAALCGVFGFSFTLLRWSTLILWALAACTTTALARRLGATNAPAALAGCLVIANPLAMNLGYTFMTDVPFMALSTLAAYGYLRSLEAGRLRWLLLGGCCGVLALWVRQFGLLLPLAFLMAAAVRWRTCRPVPGRHLVAFVAPWVIGLAVCWRLPGDPEALGHLWLPQYLGETVAVQVLGSLVFYSESLVYLGLFVLPLSLGMGGGRGPTRRGWLVGGTALALLCAATAIRAPHRLPYFGNILYDLGLGPMNIRGNLLASGELWTPHGWGGLWWIPTVLGLASAAGLLSAALRWVLRPTEADKARRPAVWFLGIWAALSVVSLYHPWLPVRFDRYLLSALVPILVLVASAPGQVAQASTRVGAGSRAPGSRPNRGLYTLQWGLAALLLIFSLRAQHDYLAWNRARWAALNDLIAAGIPPEQIDGGYEFNGWYTSPRFIERFGADAFVSSGPKGWWVVDDTYAIGWRPRPGYVVRERIPYDSWLGSDPEMLVLERE